MDYLQPFRISFPDNSLALIGLATVLYWLGLSYYRSEARKLRFIPSIGPTFPILTYAGTFEFCKDAQSVVEAGIQKWNGSLFKISALLEWWVVVTDPKLIDDLRKAPENILSSSKPIDEFLQTRFTFGLDVNENPYHFDLIKSQLNRVLPKLVAGIHDEVVHAFNLHIPPTDDWSSIRIFETAMKVVSHASNRVFVGLPLCRNSAWLDLSIQYTNDVVKTGFLLRMFPPFLRPLVNSVVSNLPKRNREGLRLIGPVIEARRKAREEQGDEYPGKPLDLLTWLMDEVKEEETQNLMIRIIATVFAAVHTSSLTFAYALFYLALFPEYWKPLRDEVEEATKSAGWTKEALDQMIKTDSFIKESQRLHPVAILLMSRLAVDDFTFSNGTTLPAGTTLSVPVGHIHLDPEIYEDPKKFDGFRFIKMKERAAADGHPDKKFDLVSTSLQSLAFGHGRHACPGRFFAAVEVKLMLAYVVMTYDVKLVNCVRPPEKWLMHNRVQDDTVEVLFRKRKDELD